MASVEGILRKVDLFSGGGGYYTSDDWVLAKANRLDGESVGDALARRCPHKTDDPHIIEVYRACLERTARAALIRAGRLDDAD